MDTKTYKIGKNYDYPIKIPTDAISVSHEHAEITVHPDGQWTITDLGSSNGTFVEIDGSFVQVGHINIKPSSWVRLGTDNKQGFYFKAHRVLSPYDYSQDFYELRKIYSQYTAIDDRLQQRNLISKLLPVLLSIIALVLTMGSDSANLLRLIIISSGAITTLAQYLLTVGLQKKRKKLKSLLICPKCRRSVNSDDIKDGFHPFCNAK